MVQTMQTEVEFWPRVVEGQSGGMMAGEDDDGGGDMHWVEMLTMLEWAANETGDGTWVVDTSLADSWQAKRWMDDETAEAVAHDDEMHVEMQLMSQEIQTVSTMTQATEFARLIREGCRPVDE
jgi:hypothetical protein